MARNQTQNVDPVAEIFGRKSLNFWVFEHFGVKAEPEISHGQRTLISSAHCRSGTNTTLLGIARRHRSLLCLCRTEGICGDLVRRLGVSPISRRLTVFHSTCVTPSPKPDTGLLLKETGGFFIISRSKNGLVGMSRLTSQPLGFLPESVS